MNASEPQVFDDPGPELSRGPLTLFIVCSIAVHVVGFAMLQVVYPPTIAKFPGDARLVLLTPNTSDPAFLSWVQSNDPADVLHARRWAGREEPLLGYLPSFGVAQLPLRIGRRPISNSEIALPRRKLPVARSLSQTARVEGAPGGRPLRLLTAVARPEGSLAARLGSTEILMGDVERSTVRPARFGYAWPRSGVVPLVFVLASTGDEAVDAQILSCLREIRPPDPDTSCTGEVSVVFVNIAAKE